MARKVMTPVFLAVLCAGMWWFWTPQSPVTAAQTETPKSAAFKITFGVSNPSHERVWSGGIRGGAGVVKSVGGWHLSVDDSVVQPDHWNIELRLIGGEVSAKGVIVEIVSPEQQPVTVYTRYGDFRFVPAEIPYGKTFPITMTKGDVTVERVPQSQTITSKATEDDDPAILRTRKGEIWTAWVAYRTRKREGFQYEGADEVMVKNGAAAAVSLTPPGDHFRVALAEDGRGRVWCVYAAQKQMETGNFDLFARSWDGKVWSAEEKLTSSPFPDAFHQLKSDAKGNLYLVWMGYRDGQSDVFLRVRSGEKWGEEINVSQSKDDDWEPSVGVDSSGRAWVAWDSYRAESGYDVLLRSYGNEGLSPVRNVSATAYAEMRADVAVDSRDRVWLTWEEGGTNWGKDVGYENPRHRLFLKKGGSRLYGPEKSQGLYRRPRVAVFANGQLMQPAAKLEDAYSPTMPKNLYLSPRLGIDGSGRIWLFLRHQLVAKGRWAGQFFDYYATTLTDRWMQPVLLPGSTGRSDTILATTPAPGGIAIATATDGRKFPVPLPVNSDISRTFMSAAAPSGDPALEPFQPSAVTNYVPVHPQEAAQVSAIRSHRVTVGGRAFKIVRGDAHRHTEISMDGAVDGSLYDLYRYAINAAALDWVAVTDHNYGQWLDTDEPETKNTDNEYQWWRTQKSADVFYVPGKFTPLYGYERSINFPLGHRNILHVKRGVFSLHVPKLWMVERPELIAKDAMNLQAYLKSTGGIGLPHSTGTNMGTNWHFRNDALEPVAELYSGDWGGFEAEGEPRAATREAPGGGNSGRAPFENGLIWNALGAGYKMGFIGSSDHWSTHIAFGDLLVPDRVTTRADIIDAFRTRRTYASTDNIIVDFYAGSVMQGGDLKASQSPTFTVKVQGTEPLWKVEIIKNNRVVFSRPGEGGTSMEFQYRDNDGFGDTSMTGTLQVPDFSNPKTGVRPRPAGKNSYYYVRAIQRYSKEFPEREGEIAWSSPIFVAQ